MTEEETYATPGVMLASAIVLTCLWFITVLGVLSGVFGHDFFTIWHLFIEPIGIAGLWLEVAEKKKMLNKRWVRYIQAVLMVIIILLIASYYRLL